MASPSYFNPITYCDGEGTTEPLRHSTITKRICLGCGKFNPAYQKALDLSLEDDCVIDENRTLSMRAPPTPPRRAPSSSSTNSQHISNILTPGSVQGAGENGRAGSVALTSNSSLSSSSKHSNVLANQSIEVRIIHAYDEQMGIWRPEKAAGYLIKLVNEELTYDTFITKCLTTLRVVVRRANEKIWVYPAETGDWDIAVDRKTNAPPTFMTPWIGEVKLSTALEEAGIPGSKELRRLVLCFRPNTPESTPRESSPIPGPSNKFSGVIDTIIDAATRPRTARGKHKIKPEVKQEVKQEKEEVKEEVKQEHKRKRSDGNQRRVDAEHGIGLGGRPAGRDNLRSSSQ